jgi:flagellar basal-body rod protein FlgF
MDRFVFAAMTGARSAMGQLAVTANNLANASTPGFREQVAAFRAVPMGGDGANTRAFAVDTTPGTSFLGGPIESTGNPFDLAFRGAGWFVVRRANGGEALTRGGNFHLDARGQLVNAAGLVVQGDAGPIVVPPNSSIPHVAEDGTVSVFVGGSSRPQVLGKLRLVKPDPKSLSRAADGLFESSAQLPSDASVKLRQGFVEGSNVSVASALVAIISQQRLFDLNVKMIQNADANARSANGIMTLSRG